MRFLSTDVCVINSFTLAELLYCDFFETTEGDWIEDDLDLEVPTNETVMSNANP